MSAALTYIIDQKDLIVDIDQDWNAFARANQSECLDENVAGQSIWKFISSGEVNNLYKELFDSVRSAEKDVTINFRCDSEAVIRFMQMQISPLPEEHLRVVTSLVKEFPRKKVLAREIVYLGMQHGTPMCSCCNRIYIKAKNFWIEVDKALSLSLINDQLNVSFEICPDCKDYLTGKVKELKKYAG